MLMSLCAATSWMLVTACSAPTVPPATSMNQHQLHLVRMVRQDCGSCHGMQLTGGLGPPLTPASLTNMPLDSVIATIYHGRPGTPMPGWKNMISEADARWIAEQLRNGFPTE